VARDAHRCSTRGCGGDTENLPIEIEYVTVVRDRAIVSAAEFIVDPHTHEASRAIDMLGADRADQAWRAADGTKRRKVLVFCHAAKRAIRDSPDMRAGACKFRP
jgi:hypothetical protein